MKKSSKKGGYARFISIELVLTIVSFIGAFLGALYLYPVAPGLFQSIAALIPNWFGTITGFAAAYAAVAALIWIASNSLLFLTGLRKA